MCWKTHYLTYTKRRIAENDIKVYKVVKAMGGGIYSYFMVKNYGFFDDDEIIKDEYFIPWQFANVQAITQPSGHFLYTIVFGYHSYSANVGTSYVNYGDEEKAFVVCGTQYQYDEHLRIMECVIPKGTAYYENEHGEIVSELIKIKKIYIPSFKDGSFGEIY